MSIPPHMWSVIGIVVLAKRALLIAFFPIAALGIQIVWMTWVEYTNAKLPNLGISAVAPDLVPANAADILDNDQKKTGKRTGRDARPGSTSGTSRIEKVTRAGTFERTATGTAK